MTNPVARLPIGKIVVLIPTYNERDNLPQTVSRLRAAVPEADVVVLDDSSPDGTGAVADQLAADGFIAVAPDLLSRVRGGPSADELKSDSATKLIRSVTVAEMNKGVFAAAQYGLSLPAATKKYGVVGYCWGGSATFNHAVFNGKSFGGGVVYYGTSPVKDSLPRIQAPILGLYGGNDARVNATIGWADTTMQALKKSYAYKIFDGAGHGFLRAQDQPANLEAAKQAWPMTISFFRANLR